MRTTSCIFLISTVNPSRLHTTPNEILYESDEPFVEGRNGCKSFHLYITLPKSDLEESKIEKGDCFTDGVGVHECIESDDSYVYFGNKLRVSHKLECVFKIIATTDENLESRMIPKSFMEYIINEYNNKKWILMKFHQCEIDISKSKFDTIFKIQDRIMFDYKYTNETKLIEDMKHTESLLVLPRKTESKQGKKIWDYNDFDGGFEDCIEDLLSRGKTIVSTTVLRYCEDPKSKQSTYFPTKVLIIYNN